MTRSRSLAWTLLLAFTSTSCSTGNVAGPVELRNGPLAPVDDDQVQVALDELPPPPPVAPGSPVGALEGAMSVDYAGNAVYEIELPIPPGRATMAPSVSLQYSSARGQGLMGRGWTVMTDSSRIARCGRTVAEDGYARPVRFDDDDRLCLDGERLVLVSGGSYWDPGAEYRTEIDRIAKIVHQPQGPAGPTFEVWTKDGEIRRYGNTPHCNGCGTIILGDDGLPEQWLLYEASDRSDNLVEYAYDHSLNHRSEETTAGDETEAFRPGTIYYTANRSAGLDATRRIDFFYQSRGDRQYGWKRGARRTSDWLLDRIEVRAAANLGPGTPPLLVYEMEYESPPPAHRKRLSGVRVCDDAGVCRPWTRFGYQDGTAGFEAPVLLGGSAPSLAAGWAYDSMAPYVLDANGDGRSDLIYPDEGWWRIRLADPDYGHDPVVVEPYLLEQSIGHPTSHAVVRGMPLDFDSDGLDDLLLFEDAATQGRAAGAATWRILLSQGDGSFSLYDTTTPYPRLGGVGGGEHAHPHEPQRGLYLSNRTRAVDWNADGRPDLVTYDLPPVGQAEHFWHVRLNDGSTFGPPIVLSTIGPGGATAYDIFTPTPLDYDGDGNQELLVLDASNQGFGISRYDNGSHVYDQISLAKPSGPQQDLRFLELNGDGLLDAVFHTLGAPGTGSQDLFVNTGNGFRGDGATFPPHGFQGTESWSRRWSLLHAAEIDYDRDGIPDLLMPRTAWYPISDPVTNWGVLEARKGADYLTMGGYDSDGDGAADPYFTTIDLPQIPYDAIGSCTGATGDSTPSLLPYSYPRARVVDFDGDGIRDLVQVECDQLVAYRGTGVRDGLLTEVWEGREPSADPTRPATYALSYSIGSDPETYTPGTSCTYPQRCETPRHDLVSQLMVDTGSTSEPLVRSYHYEDWRVDLLGHGSLGFGSVEVQEPSSSTVTRTTLLGHERNPGTGRYPLRGLVSEQERATTLDDGSVLTQRTEIDYHVLPTWPGVLVVSPATETTHTTEEAGGTTTTLHYRNTTHAQPSWHGAIAHTEIETLAGSETIDREITSNPSHWVVGAVMARWRTSTTNTGHTLEQERTYQIDMSTGRLLGTIDNPSSPTARLTTTNVHDSLGLIRRVEVSDDFGTTHATDYAYDDQDLFIVYERNPQGHEVVRTVDEAWGIPLVEADPNGLISTRQLDTFGEVVHRTLPSGQEVSYTKSSALPGSDHEWSRRALSPGHLDETIHYGRRGQPLRRTEVGPLGLQSEVHYLYGSHGELISMSEPVPTLAIPTHWTTHEYDAFGRLVGTAFPNGTSTHYDYDGLSVTFTDARGSTSTRHYDSVGNIESTEDASGAWTVYEYGPRGNITLVHDPLGNTTAITYDELGRRTKLVDPDLGERRWNYDAFGRVTATYSTEHGWRDLTLDDLGRVTSIVDVDGTTTFDFDVYGFRGQLGKHESPDGIEVLSTFDQSTGQRKTATLRLPGEAPLTMTATYDPHGRLDVLEYPPAGGVDFRVRYHYDAVGTIVAVSDADTNDVLWEATTANHRGQITTEVFGNGVVTEHDFTPQDGRIERIETRLAGAPTPDVVALEIGYDEVGNVRYRYDELQDGGQGLAEVFGYDELSQLTSVHPCSSPPAALPGALVPTVTPAGCPSELDIVYDEIGNISDRSDLGGFNYGASQPHAVTEVAGQQLDYDANGNQILFDQWQIDYTAFDLPWRYLDQSTGEEVVFEYDAVGHRSRKLTASLDSAYLDRYYRRDDAPGAAFGHPDATHRYFVFVGERVVAQIERSSAAGQAVFYDHVDHLGTVVARTDDGSSGTVGVEHFSYDAFGAPRDPDWVTQAPAAMSPDESVGFTGHELDHEIDLVNMGGRLYSPALGRFTSPDPLVQAPYSTQSLNRYSYVWNNPVTLVDPSGFQAEDPGYDDYDDFDEGDYYDGYDGQDYDDWDGPREEIEFDEGSTIIADAPPEPTEEADITLEIQQEGPVNDADGEGDNVQGLNPKLEAIAIDVATREPGARAAAISTVLFDWLFEDRAPSPQDIMVVAMPRGGRGRSRGLGRGKRPPTAKAKPAKRKPAPTCKGGECGGPSCFTADTLVATADGPVSIETIRVGDRVTPGPLGCRSTAVDGAWLRARLWFEDPADPSDVFDIVLLRPRSWFEDRGASEGGSVHIALEDVGAIGEARVIELGPAPLPEPGEGCVVLMTVTHLHDDVRSMRFVESDLALEVTGWHRLFSADRASWVAVEDLDLGERLQTSGGFVTVAGTDRIDERLRVYNLEVEARHSYLVSELEVLSHNDGDCGPNGGARPKDHQALVQERRQARAARREAKSRAKNGQNLSGKGSRSHDSARKGPSGIRPARKGGRNRERNVGIDEEHSRVAKGQGGRGARTR